MSSDHEGRYGMSGGIGGKMPHSHSTPAGVDGGGSRTPPTTPRKAGKMLAFRVQMLDDSITMFQVQVSLSIFLRLGFFFFFLGAFLDCIICEDKCSFLIILCIACRYTHTFNEVLLYLIKGRVFFSDYLD